MILKSFVQRKRPLSKAKQLLLEETLPKFKASLENIRPTEKLILEIGFGTGDFLAAISKTQPDSLFIGCEPYVEGVISLLRKIKDNDIKNIRIWPDDARILLSTMPDHCIDIAYILFPDPWPKRKQQKRRLISLEFIKSLCSKLKPAGMIFFATDHHEYAAWAFNHFTQSKDFICEDISESSTEHLGHCMTKYHKKNLEGKPIKLFRFQSVFKA